MSKRYEFVNLGRGVETFEGHLVQPRTRRVLELETDFSDRTIQRLRARGVLVQESTREAQNDEPLPPAEPELVEAYDRLSRAQTPALREEVLAGVGNRSAEPAKKTTAAPSPAPKAAG